MIYWGPTRVFSVYQMVYWLALPYNHIAFVYFIIARYNAFLFTLFLFILFLFTFLLHIIERKLHNYGPESSKLLEFENSACGPYTIRKRPEMADPDRPPGHRSLFDFGVRRVANSKRKK